MVVCPHCGQIAPLVYRGVQASCSACGRGRAPLTSSSVTHAGQPSKVGGAITRVFGWFVLGGGLVLAAVLAFFAYLVAGASMAPWLLGLPVAFVALLMGWLLLRGGRELTASGDRAEHTTRRRAVLGIAAARGGVVTAPEVARALDIAVDDADRLLTRLAKEEMEHVSVDVDDHGNVLYRFGGVRWPNEVRVGEPTRVASPEAPATQEVSATEAAPRYVPSKVR